MAGFQRGDVILQKAAQAHHLQGVRAKGFLMMVTQGNEKKKAGQKRDHHDADRGPGEKFEMKMFRAEKPCGGSAKNATTYLGGLGYVDLSHYKSHKSR
jgi:hypothetical protein